MSGGSGEVGNVTHMHRSLSSLWQPSGGRIYTGAAAAGWDVGRPLSSRS